MRFEWRDRGLSEDDIDEDGNVLESRLMEIEDDKELVCMPNSPVRKKKSKDDGGEGDGEEGGDVKERDDAAE